MNQGYTSHLFVFKGKPDVTITDRCTLFRFDPVSFMTVYIFIGLFSGSWPGSGPDPKNNLGHDQKFYKIL